MAVKYIIFEWNFDNFALIRLGTITREFLRSLITNLKSESQNSKWRIQYGGQVHDFMVKLWRFCCDLLRNGYERVFEVADYESEVRISKLKMANPIWRSSTRFYGETLPIWL